MKMNRHLRKIFSVLCAVAVLLCAFYLPVDLVAEAATIKVTDDETIVFGFEKNEEECSQLVDIVNASGASVLLVGVGAPKQEKWIRKYRYRMPNVKIFMALGATIDFEANELKRAPAVYQKIGMEWFYRFLKEPRRLYRRYFIDDIKFFYYFLKQLLGIYKNPFSCDKGKY